MTTSTKHVWRVLAAAALATTVALGGCASEKSAFDPEKPLDKMSKEEWCDFYARYIASPKISAASRASATQQMRARGCPNHA